jgi:hypothetical protein
MAAQVQADGTCFARRPIVPVDDLPAAWNEKYEQYLGARPQWDAEGVPPSVQIPAKY